MVYYEGFWKRFCWRGGQSLLAFPCVCRRWFSLRHALPFDLSAVLRMPAWRDAVSVDRPGPPGWDFGRDPADGIVPLARAEAPGAKVPGHSPYQWAGSLSIRILRMRAAGYPRRWL